MKSSITWCPQFYSSSGKSYGLSKHEKVEVKHVYCQMQAKSLKSAGDINMIEEEAKKLGIC